MTFQAKQFSNRKEIERFVLSACGADIEKNKQAEHVLQGTREELAQLRLSDRASVYGVKCVITDTPTKDYPKMKAAEIVEQSKKIKKLK